MQHRKEVWMAIALATAVPFAAYPQATDAGPQVQRIDEYYDISGRTPDELLAQIQRKGPSGWAGHTQAHVQYRYATAAGADGCRITVVRAGLEAQVKLPRWVDRDRAPVGMRQWWDHYSRTLEQHESGHVKIAEQTAEEVQRALAQIAPAPSCDAVKAEASRRADPLLSAMQAKQDEYDRSTDHGRRN